jgi:hypothetical protein
MDMGNFSPVKFLGIGIGNFLITLRLWAVALSRELTDTYQASKRYYQEDCILSENVFSSLLYSL